MEPRAQPLPEDGWDDFRTSDPYNLFTTLGRHPRIYRAWLRFGGELLHGTLPARDRELAILRTAWHRRSAYEWARHALFAREAGLTDDEIESVRQPAALWQVEDRLVLQVADDLHAAGDVTDATWAALCDRYDELARIELVMLVAHYDMLAMVLNTLRATAEE